MRTNDVAYVLRVSLQVQACVTWVNGHLPITSEDPQGGVTDSSLGKDIGHEWLLGNAVTHHIMVKHAKPIVHDSFRPAWARYGRLSPFMIAPLIDWWGFASTLNTLTTE